jgi:hypothetical protein
MMIMADKDDFSTDVEQAIETVRNSGAYRFVRNVITLELLGKAVSRGAALDLELRRLLAQLPDADELVIEVRKRGDRT